MNFSDYDLYKLATPPEYEREEGPSAEPQQSTEEPQPPCPHGQPTWRRCQWCVTGVSPPREEDVEEDIAW